MFKLQAKHPWIFAILMALLLVIGCGALYGIVILAVLSEPIGLICLVVLVLIGIVLAFRFGF
jgi:hypothetical protein